VHSAIGDGLDELTRNLRAFSAYPLPGDWLGKHKGSGCGARPCAGAVRFTLPRRPHQRAPYGLRRGYAAGHERRFHWEPSLSRRSRRSLAASLAWPIATGSCGTRLRVGSRRSTTPPCARPPTPPP